ncbi:MAG: hypothetical protein K0B15_06530 [Lentimicrobium sp.]|nr:hypothetical protein [Lentimicrobium sp.]
MSKLFILNGIKSPGKVNLKRHGTVNLEDVSDDIAIELFKSGCPFLVPTKEYFELLYPDGMPFDVRDIEPPSLIFQSKMNQTPRKKRSSRKET